MDDLTSEKAKSVIESYDRGEHSFSTRTSEGFVAVERSSKSKVYLWLLRFPLAVQSEESQRFSQRLARIERLQISTLPFRTFGVDGSGAAYLVTSFSEVFSLFNKSSSPMEAERLYLEVLKAVSVLHAEGIALGDISEDSFVVDASGRVLVMGLLGAFDSGARQTAMLPPTETYHYVSPEQRGGSAPDILSDIFGLGVFGYRLFTGRYLLSDKAVAGGVENPVGSAPAPSIVNPLIPNWVDDVLGRCLELSPEHRYHDSSEMVEVIERSIRSGSAPGGTSLWSRRTMIVRPPEPGRDRSVGAEASEVVSRVKGAKEKKATKSSPKRSLILIVWAFALILGVVIAGFIFFSLDAFDFEWLPEQAEDRAETTSDDPFLLQAEYAPEDLKELILKLRSVEEPDPNRIETLAKIAESEDPIAYGILIAVMKSGPGSELKKAARGLLVDRIRRHDLPRSADVISKWFDDYLRANKDPGEARAYAYLLPACDPARPLATRVEALRKAYEFEPVAALQLSAALALDDEDSNFEEALKGFLLSELQGENVRDRGLGALLLSHNALSIFVDRDFVDTLNRFSDADLKWSFQKTAEQNNQLMYSIADEISHRKMLSPYEEVFLEALIRGKDSATPRNVVVALVRGVSGTVSTVDLEPLGRWMSMSVEPVLLAVCATTDIKVSLPAFDILSARSLLTQPASGLIAWIKSRFWDYRKRTVKAVGVLGLISKAPENDVNQAFEALMPFAAGDLFSALVGTGNVYLTVEAVRRLGAITRSGELLPLLTHDDKQVRLATVMALKGRNELAVLQSILKHYEKEKDEEVKAAYRDNHWVTRDRRDKRFR